MALVVADRVQQTTTTAGTGTVTLSGSVTGYQSFSAIGNGNTTYYTLVDGSNWEVGIGTYTASGTTLSRDTVYASSAGGTTKITLSGGTTNVFVTYPAEIATMLTNPTPTNGGVVYGTGTAIGVSAVGTAGQILLSGGAGAPTWSNGAVYTKTSFTATAGQTSFSVTYTVGYLDVFYNGSKLSTSEYTATTGTTVVLGTACNAGDIVETIAWAIWSVTNTNIGIGTGTSLALGGATIGSNALAVTGTTALSGLLTAAGGVSSTLVTDATSATTGSIITAGGISTQKALWVGTTSRLVGNVQADALVAIGTTSVSSPQANRSMLQISTMGMIDALVNQPQLRLCANEYINSSNSPTYITTNVATQYAQSAGSHSWSYAASGTAGTAISYTTAMTLDTGGRLGIGVTPTATMGTVQAIADSNQYAFTAYRAANNVGFGLNGIVIALQNSSSAVVPYAAVGGTIATNTAGSHTGNMVFNVAQAGALTEAARFDTSGNLCVNTTSAAGKITVTASGSVSLSVTQSANSSQCINSNVGGTGALHMAFQYQGGGTIGSISAPNNVSVAYNTSSDERLKTVLSDQRDFRSIITDLWVGDIEWKALPGSRQMALLAQQANPLYPDAIRVGKDDDEMWQSDYSKLAPLALWGVKDLYKIIDDLTTRLAALENK